MISYKRILFLGFLLSLLFLSCRKSTYEQAPSTNPPTVPGPLPAGFALSYGDSAFFLKNSTSDYIVTPVQHIDGQYFAYPEGIELDGNTGAINVSKSETGLKYKISFVPDGKTDTFSSVVLISGINFLDGFYKLSGPDSVAHPIYNGDASAAVPGLNNGSLFDEGSNCNSEGCTVNIGNGQINLAQTVRNGVFGSTPSNNDRHEFQLNYRINDKSGETLNTIRVKLYYFDSMNDVTQEAYDIISSREGTIINSSPVFTSSFPIIAVNSFKTIATTGVARSAKPRPPCIFIVSH